MHECVLLNMFCSICLIAIIALKLIYVFKGKLENWVENAKCQMLYASETGCYYYYYLQYIVLVSSGGKM